MYDFYSILALIQSPVNLGLCCSLVVLALYLSYSMLNVCDLSTEGCFTLGAAVGALLVKAGLPYLSLPVAMLAGMTSGLITAVLQTRMGVNSLLSGIVVNTALYSVNQLLIGSQINLVDKFNPSIFTHLNKLLSQTALGDLPAITQVVPNLTNSIICLIAVSLVVLFLSFFLRTKLGMAIRATGNNPDMVRSSSINPSFTTTVGLVISNSFTALAGCLLAQMQKNATITTGSGILTMALASLLIGGTIFRRGGVTIKAIGAVIGAILFRLAYQVAMLFSLPTQLINAFSSVIVVAVISAPYLSGKMTVLRRRMKMKKAAMKKEV